MDASPSTVALLDERWRLGGVIGRGAAADVHEATDVRTGRTVALKVLRVVDAEAVARFEREVVALETLDHPGIVAVLGHGTCPDGRPYLVLERADGGTLADAFAAGPLGPDRAAELGAALAEALDHAHRRGVVHRDVKPGNVLLGVDGRAQLADFGIARLVDATALTASGWGLGTPAYLAPEQVRGEPVGAAADVYSLGLVVLEAATGERAYPGEGLAAALARVEQPPFVPPTLPPALAAAIRAMTATGPADRPTAADAVAQLRVGADAGDTMAIPVAAIETATWRVPAPVAPAESAAPAPEPVRRSAPPAARRALVAAACFAVGFLAVLAVWAVVAADGRGGDADPVAELDAPGGTTTVPTTAAPTTTTTTTAPPLVVLDDADERPRPGNGNGNGNGRDRDGDD